jgi:type I restriction enzyme S subunit
VSVRAPVGQVNVATETCGIGRGLASIRATRYPHALLYALLSDSGIWTPFEDGGTVFGSVSKNQLAQIAVSWPSAESVDQLEAQLKPLSDRLRIAVDENLTLTRIGNALLPVLLSGRVPTKNAERVVEEAT